METTPSELTRMTEAEAREWIENIRWPDGPICPKCGSVNAMRLGGKAGEKGQCKCRDCRKKFTVRVGTIFEESPLPLRDWVYAIVRMCSSKKGVSAHQIHREIGVTYKTAWFMCHRIRHAMQDGSLKLGGNGGTVESDEAYCGGKPRKKNRKGGMGKQGKSNKTPIQVLVERGGKKQTRAMTSVTSANLKQNINDLVDPDTEIHTDENKQYRTATKGYKGHRRVNHSFYEYYRRDGDVEVTTNTAESSFALIKRGLYGTFHHCSKEHLQRYLDEFDFRWNHREATDVQRAIATVEQVGGKRLTYGCPS